MVTPKIITLLIKKRKTVFIYCVTLLNLKATKTIRKADIIFVSQSKAVGKPSAKIIIE